MERQVVVVPGAPKPGAHLSSAIRVDGLIFTSGQLGVSPETGWLVDGGVVEQARQALENISAILSAAGSSMDRVVKTTVFLTDIKHRTEIGSVYSEYFPTEPPARSAVAVKELANGALIEIEAIAIV